MSKYLVAFLIVLALVAGADARSRRRPRANGGTPGVFDYYLLTLSWAPDFCDLNPGKGNARECGTGNHTGFIVHGLWPQYNNGGYPQNCAPSSPVAAGIVNQLLPVMTAAGLIQHEWATHGTCSGLSQADYFGLVLKGFQAVKAPPAFKNLNAPAQLSPNKIEQAFYSANPSFPQGSVHVGCTSGELLDVRICLSKSLTPQACSINDCQSGQLKVLPPR